MVKLTFKEEVANSVSHGVMATIILFSLPFIGVLGYLRSGTIGIIANGVFGISIFLMLMSSTLYHTMEFDSVHKQVFRKLDHIMIFVAIAGSYTPVALELIGGVEGLIILLIQWLGVLFGIFYKIFGKSMDKKLSLVIYIAMGWSVVLFLPTVIANSTPMFLGLITLGGIFYSVGAYFYTKRTMKYHHLIWHIFINMAVVTHFIAIIFYI